MSGHDDSTVMRAAGGVLWRRRDDSEVEVVLVHRPGHDDWSLPKGKAERDEDDLACALREVEEETGVRGVPGPELPTVGYLDKDGRRKVVRFWAMRPERARVHESDDEIDEIEWLRVADARAKMTYEADGVVLDGLVSWLGEDPLGEDPLGEDPVGEDPLGS
jgi:8-oxo-dGTP pyrophosphatase MutT (NUDIX family)